MAAGRAAMVVVKDLAPVAEVEDVGEEKVGDKEDIIP